MKRCPDEHPLGLLSSGGVDLANGSMDLIHCDPSSNGARPNTCQSAKATAPGRIDISYFYIMECSHLGRITIDPAICHGKPCIRGMRWPVEVIIDMLGAGMSTEEILAEHPELEKEDIQASLNYAKLMVSGHSLGDVA